MHLLICVRCLNFARGSAHLFCGAQNTLHNIQSFRWIQQLYFIYSKIKLSFMFDTVKLRMWSWFLVNIMFGLMHSAIVVHGSCKHKHTRTLEIDSVSIRAFDLIGYSFCILYKFINVYIFWDWNVNECNWYYYFMCKLLQTDAQIALTNRPFKYMKYYGRTIDDREIQ